MKREGNQLIIGGVTITARRFPWQTRTTAAILSSNSERKAVGQKYGWRGTDGMGRFGGGWNWQLGFQAGGKTVLFMLLIGTVTISWWKKP